jgi:hypothetical protein
MRQVGFLVVVGLVGCAHNVRQDAATGPDGKPKGAVPVVVQDGEGKAHGIVTYPGGDRVDWKLIQLPEGQKGKLDLALKYRTPRPGLHVAFDVFDQWNTPVTKAAKPVGKQMSATIDNAQGKYLVRIYAPKRGDAGAYDLVASFVPTDTGKPPAPIVVADPPKLPAVPEVEPECDPFDVKIKACQSVCPDFGAPVAWKACADKDKAEKERIAAEEAAKAAAEREKNKPKPMDKRILNANVINGETQIIIGIGTDAQPRLDTSWTAEVVNSKTGKPLANGQVEIIRVGKTQVLAKVKLPTDIVNQNLTVRLTPPP